MIRNFEDLLVWQRAHSIVLTIYRVTKTYPHDEKFGLVNQIRRSAVSICSNLAEGNKKSTKDYLRFISISIGSLEETRYHLILSRDLGYCRNEDFKYLYAELDEVGRMLSGLVRSLQLSVPRP